MFKDTTATLMIIAVTFALLLALCVLTPLIEIILNFVAIVLLVALFALFGLGALVMWNFNEEDLK